MKFPGASDLALDLLRGLLRFDPEERLTAEAALQHAFFQHTHPSPSKDPAASSRPVPMKADIEKMGESAANLWNNVFASLLFSPPWNDP